MGGHVKSKPLEAFSNHMYTFVHSEEIMVMQQIDISNPISMLGYLTKVKMKSNTTSMQINDLYDDAESHQPARFPSALSCNVTFMCPSTEQDEVREWFQEVLRTCPYDHVHTSIECDGGTHRYRRPGFTLNASDPAFTTSA